MATKIYEERMVMIELSGGDIDSFTDIMEKLNKEILKVGFSKFDFTQKEVDLIKKFKVTDSRQVNTSIVNLTRVNSEGYVDEDIDENTNKVK